jgi:fluoroacetyl-CoA thioesterase
MKPIPAGARGSFTLFVQPQHLANRFKDATLPAVFATPVMIMTMENAALNAIKPYLDPGESAVGTAVDVRHLAATPVGSQVTAEAEVTKVAGRRIEFAVRATEGAREIGVGTHARVVVDVAKFTRRLQQEGKRE